MKARASRALVAAALLLAVLAGAAALLLRQSLLRAPIRQAIEARLSAALGQRVTIGGFGFSLFPRPALTGSNIRVGVVDVESPSVRLARIQVVPKLRSVFSDAMAIDDVRLEGFVVSVLHGRDGRWHAPAGAPLPGGDGGSTVSIARVRITQGQLRVFDETSDGALRERSSIDDIDAEVVPGRTGVRLSPIRGSIGGTEISGEASADRTSMRLEFGAPAVRDDDLAALLALLGSVRPDFLRLDRPAALSATVRIDRASSRLAGSGSLRAPAVTLDPLRVQDFEAPFTIDGSRLRFEPTTFTLYQGSHRGSVAIALDREPPRWSADSRVERLDLGAFLDALAGEDARIDGTAEVEATVGGPVGASLARTVGGRAHLSVSDGVVHDFPLLAAINRALRLTEESARDTRFRRLTATLAIGDGSATTNDLTLDAGDVQVAAAGRIRFDRAIDLRGVATLSAERTAAAVASIHELARLRRNGTIALPLAITGTLDKPAFAIDMKAAIEKGIADELMRRLGRIIRR